MSSTRKSDPTAVKDEDRNSVILKSSDGFTFIARKSAVLQSPVIKSMLNENSAFSEALQNMVEFPNMSGQILEKVCQYFYYYEKYKGQRDIPDPEFVTPELALELLYVADYLDC